MAKKYAFLYHLNAYTYGDPAWFPDMASCTPGYKTFPVRVSRSAMA
jgi:hypothetical protein